MADLSDLENALRNADKAGDTDAAKALAGEITRIRGATLAEPAPPNRTTALNAGLNRGMAGLLGLPADTLLNAYNLVKAGVGTAEHAILGAPLPDLTDPASVPGTSATIARLGEQKLGMPMQNPNPNDAASRMLYTGGTVLGGGPSTTVRGAVLPAAGAAIAGELLGPEYAALGAMAPGVAGAGAGAARNAVAGRTAANLDAFNRAGAQPSVGQAMQLNFAQGLENLLARFPGGQGVFRRFAENQQEALGAGTRTGVSAEDAGRALERGISGRGGFLERTRQTWLGLQGELDAKVPKDAGVSPTNSLKTLDSLTAPTAGAELSTGGLANPVLQKLRENLLADVQQTRGTNLLTTGATEGQIPYQALRDIRTRVGSMLDDSLVSGVPNGELKQLYGALSKDLEGAANANGAGPEFARQNAYYSARMDRIELVLDRVLGKGRQPEDVFNAVMPKDPDQANKLRAVMRSLEPAERQVVSDAVVNRLGRATPGRQNDVGDKFSSDVFLTNWNKLSPGAKAQLFPDEGVRRDLEALANVSNNIKDGSKVFGNPSGSAGAGAAYAMGGAAAGAAAATGSVMPLLYAGSLAGAANIGARMLTSPAVVRWLATSSKAVSEQDQVAQLARLGVIFNQTTDAKLKSELSDYITSVSQTVGKNGR